MLYLEIRLLLLLPIDALKLLGGAIPLLSVYWLHPWRFCFLKLRDGGASVPADFLPGLSFIAIISVSNSLYFLLLSATAEVTVFNFL